MKWFTSILTFFPPMLISAQLTVNAGKDTTICVTWNTPGTLILGGNPTVSGGMAPYSYTWECNYNYIVGPNTYLLTASDFLSDTTIANPDLILNKNSPITFYLKVEDDAGQIAMDTIIVSFSIFWTNLTEYDYYINAGDSIFHQFNPNVIFGTPPVTYLWQPNHGLSDSTSSTNFWVKPMVNTSYYVTVTDAVGCVVTGNYAFHVYVGNVNLDELNFENDEELILYPNPTDGRFIIRLDETTIDLVQIYNEQGEIIMTHEKYDQDEINLTYCTEGVYTIIINKNAQKYTKRLIKSE